MLLRRWSFSRRRQRQKMSAKIRKVPKAAPIPIPAISEEDNPDFGEPLSATATALADGLLPLDVVLGNG